MRCSQHSTRCRRRLPRRSRSLGTIWTWHVAWAPREADMAMPAGPRARLATMLQHIADVPWWRGLQPPMLCRCAPCSPTPPLLPPASRADGARSPRRCARRFRAAADAAVALPAGAAAARSAVDDDVQAPVPLSAQVSEHGSIYVKFATLGEDVLTPAEHESPAVALLRNARCLITTRREPLLRRAAAAGRFAFCAVSWQPPRS